jgi:hypothetical protein
MLPGGVTKRESSESILRKPERVDGQKYRIALADKISVSIPPMNVRPA